MTTLLALLIALAVVSVAGGCSSDEEGPSEDGSGAAGGGSSIEVAVGEEADLRGVVVLVSSLAPALRPTLPDSTVRAGAAVPPAGSVFYQARLLVTNRSEDAAWLDPGDFTLVTGDSTLYVDPTRSGPRPRALLPTASLNMILTFPGPPDLPAPVLEFRPAWYGAGLKVSGAAAPADSDVGAAAD